MASNRHLGRIISLQSLYEYEFRSKAGDKTADIDSIVVPANGTGKVRTDKVLVLREVPLEECGLLGKILAKKQKKAKA